MSVRRLLLSCAFLMSTIFHYSFGQCTGVDISCPDNVTVCAGSNTQPIATGFATATGSGFCGAPTITFQDYVQVNADCPGAQIITRTWTASFPLDNNLTTSCTQTIWQGDFADPVFVGCPANIVVQSDNENCDAIVSWNVPTATDDCGIANIVANYPPGSTFPLGNTLVFYTAVDHCGQSATCSFMVTVECGQVQGNCGLDGASNANIHFSLDECHANSISGTNADYTEFESQINIGGDAACANISSSNIYRQVPEENTHSCTQGIYNTPGMCVGVERSCVYEPDSEKAVRFEVTIDPLLGNTSIDHLEFYESAPTTFGWLGGSSGMNDFPTRYAVRVLANGVEIFHQFDLLTSHDWTREFFDFTNNPAFTVSALTTFEFQLTAYCAVTMTSPYTIWDLDAISVNASCGEVEDSEMVHGGTITGGPFTYCADDGTAYYIPNGSITQTGDTGSNGQWIVTDMQGTILAISDTPYNINLSSFDNDSSQLFFLSYETPIYGFALGNSIYSQLVGCFGLSNPLAVSPSDLTACSLSGGPFEFCVTDNEDDNIPMGSVTENCNGMNGVWLITDEFGNILEEDPNPHMFNYSDLEVGTAFLYYLGYDDMPSGVTNGFTSIADISGCFSLSTPIQINLTNCSSNSSFGNNSTEEEEEEENIDVELEAHNNQAVVRFDFELYPNPTSSFVNIKFDGLSSSIVSFELTDVIGNLITRSTADLNGLLDYQIDLTSFNAGVYLINIKNGKQAMVKRFVKL